jgi:predicted aspartyl protease
MGTSNTFLIRTRLNLLIVFSAVVLIFIPIGAFPQVPPSGEQVLDALLSKKRYPQLEQALQVHNEELSPQARSYFSGVIANRLNRVTESLELLEPLFPNLCISNPARGEVALCTVADDYAKLHLYREAARTYAEASRVAGQQKLNSTCDAAREASRWALLSNAPAQTVTSAGKFTIQGQWDVLGLIQVPVSAGGYGGLWILDSGANISVVSQSVAERIGVAISSATDTAQGASGAPVRVHSGVVPELRLGSAVFHNVPVLVVADSELDFPQVNYRIEGSLGLPVLATLGRVTVYRDGRVDFGGTSDVAPKALLHNLFLEKFTPVVTADFGLGDQLFTIDTGAAGTILSAAFYRESKAGNLAELVQLELLGAGGTLVSPAYQLRDVDVKLGGGCTKLETVQMLTKPTGLADEFYGNIGESALSSFATFTLDFNAMHFNVNGPRVCE